MSELNEKINNLNLVSLRKYACAKVSGEKEWYLKCLECSGVDDCSCGRRARDILESQTKPGKREKGMPDNNIFLKAWKSGNPKEWLVQNGFYGTPGSAANAFRTWIKKTGMISEEDLKKNRGALCSDGGKKSGEIAVQKARKRVADIFDGTSDYRSKQIAVLNSMSPNSKCKAAYTNTQRWSVIYPDLEERYRFKDPCRIFGLRKNMNRSVEDMLNELSSEPASEEDEVSVEDFLNETETDIPEKAAEPVREQPKPTTDAAEEHVDASPSKEVLRYEFGKKRLEFLNRLKKLEEAKKLIDEEVEDLKRQIGLLDQTAEIFGMRAVRSIDCKTA